MQNKKIRIWSRKYNLFTNDPMWPDNQRTSEIFLLDSGGEVREFITCDGENYFWDLTNHKKEELIVQSFTGLQDKNNKNIYEGDILLCYPDNTALVKIESDVYFADESLPKRPEIDLVIYKGTVRYNPEFCCFELKTINHPIVAASQLSRTKFLYEIIGNIFENPELIKNQ